MIDKETLRKTEKKIQNYFGKDKKLLKIKYGEKQKDWQIGFKLGISQSSVTRIRQGLAENVARWEQWYKNTH